MPKRPDLPGVDALFRRPDAEGAEHEEEEEDREEVPRRLRARGEGGGTPHVQAAETAEAGAPSGQVHLLLRSGDS